MIKKTRLLYVITKLELGGAQKQLLSLIKSLNKEKYEVFLFCAREGLLIDEALGIKSLILYRSGFLERRINPIKDLAALIELYLFIKRNKIQIVHTHSSKAGIIGRLGARFAGVKIIIHTVHGWSFHDYQPAILHCFYRFLEKLCAKFSNKIIVVSAFDKNKGLKNSIGKPEKYEIIRYCLDYDKSGSRQLGIEFRKSLGAGVDNLVIGTVACLKPQKAPLAFVKLASKLIEQFPSTKFVIIGDGILRKQAQALIKKLNLSGKVILAGWSRNVPEILSAIDIFVLTSLWEGLPIAVLEAMAQGLPVVATNTGGISEVLSDQKSSYLTDPGDLVEMQSCIEKLLKSPSLREEFGTEAQAVINSGEFSPAKMVMDTENLYSELLEGARHV